jgi:hypothetical protein
MDFNLGDKKFNKVIVIIFVAIALLIGGICIYLTTRDIEEPVVEQPEDTTIVVDKTPINTEPVIVEQDETIGCLAATVKTIKDLSTRLEFDISVGLGDKATDSRMKATSKVVCVDIAKKLIINPSEIKVGDNIIVYATGKYTVGDLDAYCIGLGTDASYGYGTVTAINSNGPNSQIWTIDGISDKLIVHKDCVLIDGFTGNELFNDGILQVNERILFKGEYAQSDIGGVYTCTEIIRLGK